MNAARILAKFIGGFITLGWISLLLSMALVATPETVWVWLGAGAVTTLCGLVLIVILWTLRPKAVEILSKIAIGWIGIAIVSFLLFVFWMFLRSILG